MKSFLLYLAIIFSIHHSAIAQSDSIPSSKKSTYYKSNIKTQAFVFLPLLNLHLSYEYALSKKISTGLFVQYFTGKISLNPEKSISIAPYANYYFSSFQKNKYNRGFFGQVIIPFYYQEKTTKDFSAISVSNINIVSTKAISMGLGGGYQFIIGKRFITNLSLAFGPSIYTARKESVILTDWEKSTNKLFTFKNIAIGFTF